MNTLFRHWSEWHKQHLPYTCVLSTENRSMSTNWEILKIKYTVFIVWTHYITSAYCQKELCETRQNVLNCYIRPFLLIANDSFLSNCYILVTGWSPKTKSTLSTFPFSATNIRANNNFRLFVSCLRFGQKYVFMQHIVLRCEHSAFRCTLSCDLGHVISCILKAKDRRPNLSPILDKWCVKSLSVRGSRPFHTFAIALNWLRSTNAYDDDIDGQRLLTVEIRPHLLWHNRRSTFLLVGGTDGER